MDARNRALAFVDDDGRWATLSTMRRRRNRNRLELALRIREAVLAFPHWRIETTHLGTEFMRATIGELEIVRTTPATPDFGAPASNGIDIWAGRKVFSMWWPDGDVDDDEFEIVAFATGDWFAPLVGGC